MTGLLLRNGDFVACVYRGLVDDFAADMARAMATKIVKAARKKFGKMILHVFDSEISAWDYFCHAVHAGESRTRDKFISDYIRVSLMSRLERLRTTELNLLAISALALEEIDEDSALCTEAVFERVHAEILRLAFLHGEALPKLVSPAPRSFAQSARPLLSAHSSMNGASPT